MKILKKILKIVGIILLSLIIIIALYLAYDKYEKYEKKKSELIYQTERTWKWINDYSDIQISKYKIKDDSEDITMLRKVYMNKKYSIYAYKDSNYKLRAAAIFYVKCKPNSKIVTTKKFSSNLNKELICDDKGEALVHSVSWTDSDTDTNFIWKENLDGFSFYEDFSNWDFTEVDKNITLSKAK